MKDLTLKRSAPGRASGRLPLSAGCLLFSVALILSACDPAGTPGTGTIVYEDTIPCADCPGIIMSIGLDTSAGTYTRNMTYLEATADGKDRTFSTAGTYSIEKGYKGDESALLYVLEAPPSGREQVFLAAGDSAIIGLDGNREIIRSGLNFTLRKKD